MKTNITWLLIGIVVFFSGCDFGLSEKDIEEAITSVSRALESTEKLKPEIINQYANAVDMRVASGDGSLVNNISVQVNEDQSAKASGAFVFSEYDDADSGYTIDGELKYEIKMRSINSSQFTGNFVCDVELSGGKIYALEFSFDMNSYNQISNYWLKANGEDIELDRFERIKNIIQKLDPNVS